MLVYNANEKTKPLLFFRGPDSVHDYFIYITINRVAGMEVGGHKRLRWGLARSCIETDCYIRTPIPDDISGLPIHDKFYYDYTDCKLKKINKNFKKHRCAPYLDRVNRVATEMHEYTRAELGAVHQHQIQTERHGIGDNDQYGREEI